MAGGYEAGPTGFGLSQALSAAGIRCEVVAPSKLQRPSDGSTVVLITDTGQPGRDRYGRMLSYVDHAGTDAARELLAAGAARVYDTDQQLARETDYAAAAQDAHSAETGPWGSC